MLYFNYSDKNLSRALKIKECDTQCALICFITSHNMTRFWCRGNDFLLNRLYQLSNGATLCRVLLCHLERRAIHLSDFTAFGVSVSMKAKHEVSSEPPVGRVIFAGCNTFRHGENLAHLSFIGYLWPMDIQFLFSSCRNIFVQT